MTTARQTPAYGNAELLPAGEIERMSPSSVSPDGITFTPGEGQMIESSDHRFAVGLSFRFQLLYTLLDKDPALDRVDQSLQIRRARLLFAGSAFGRHNKYKLELAVAPSDVDLRQQIVHQSPLLEAYTEFDYLRDLTVRAGQYKVPYDRMRVTSDMARQLVDFSGGTNEFSLDRDTGVAIKSNDLFGLGLLRYHLGVFSGKGRNFSSIPTDMGLMYIARADVLPFGLFDDYVEGDFQRFGPRLSIGGAYAHIQDAPRDRGTLGNVPLDNGTTTMNMFVVDGSFKLYGLSVLGAFYYRHGNRNPGSLTDATGKPITDPATGKAITAPTSTRDGRSVVAQAGYLFPRTSFEVEARYSNITGRTTPGHNGLKDSSELGGGVSYYFARHHLKLQSDYFRIYKDSVSNGYNQVRLQLQFVM
jgi:hypothetical protein